MIEIAERRKPGEMVVRRRHSLIPALKDGWRLGIDEANPWGPVGEAKALKQIPTPDAGNREPPLIPCN